ncbi:hypothetical protein L1987_32954 [Smallanthus sonchifolius]|uniref:Uncharacterized protein n=1 Tax=Smallanthus sonchifolius TaxID=185202 RepID=A0ACB9HQD8_9ASTR|nr:hypothetical protein L1987_32954 [Smallanthus sonchifolius]
MNDNMEDIGSEILHGDVNATPIRGIGLRVTNIDGNPLLPRRGMFKTSNASVLDGLFDISKPVESKQYGGHVGVSAASTTHAHANPSSDYVGQDGGNSTQVADVGSDEPKPPSFAKIVQDHKEVVKVNFRKMETEDKMEGVDVVIPVASVEQVNDRYANTLYGYFWGKRLVEYFAKNQWAKYGLIRLMMNAKGFFFFKFKTKKGLELLLEDGPWMIRNVPIILNEWSPSVTVVKEDITAIPVWVKMHEVPLVAFTEDGLSLLASKVGVPKMLDSYTASMCVESWGRSSFARALIEVQAGSELKRSIKVAVPSLEGNGFSKAEVKVEYDWEPLRCSACCVFGHEDSSCPKKPKAVVDDGSKNEVDGFREVRGKNKKGNQQGFQVKSQKPKMVYRPIAKNKPQRDIASSSQVRVSNSFEVLQDDDVEASGTHVNQPSASTNGGKVARRR